MTKFNKESSETVQHLRRKKSALQHRELFTLDWTAAGHTEVTFLVRKEDATKAWLTNEADMMSVPYVVVVDLAITIFGSDASTCNATLKKTLEDYSKSFPKSKQAMEEDMVAAPLSAGHGADALKPLWNEAFNQKVNLNNHLSQLSTVAMKPWIFGYTSTCCHMDYEPEFLGTMKLICTGKLKVLLVSAHSLRAAQIAAAQHDSSESMAEIISVSRLRTHSRSSSRLASRCITSR